MTPLLTSATRLSNNIFAQKQGSPVEVLVQQSPGFTPEVSRENPMFTCTTIDYEQSLGVYAMTVIVAEKDVRVEQGELILPTRFFGQSWVYRKDSPADFDRRYGQLQRLTGLGGGE